MNPAIHEGLVAFFVFAIIRYSLPNLILGKEISLWSGFILSFFYTLSVLVRSYAKNTTSLKV
jgi:hypothetical protein